VFLDGRNEVAPDLLREVAAARSDAVAWQALLERHGVDSALVRYRGERWPVVRARPADGEEPVALAYHSPSYLLFPRERFALYHWDDVCMLFVRRTSASRDWLERAEYRLVHPEDVEVTLAAASDESVRRGMLAELARRLAEDPGCERARRLRAALEAR
jgi:hypothetical protein